MIDPEFDYERSSGFELIGLRQRVFSVHIPLKDQGPSGGLVSRKMAGCAHTAQSAGQIDKDVVMSKTKPTAKTYRPKTQMIRAGQNRAMQETSEALFLTSGFAYTGPQQAAERFSGEDPGFIYSRFSNPTVEMFEHRIAAIEGAEFARATASGMAAVSAAMLCQLSAGDHIVASRALFGSCRYVVQDLCSRFGIEASLIDGTRLENWREASKPNTKVFFLESPSNPGIEVLDIAAIASIARDAKARLVVDNVFATPILQKPLELGADIVVYSATKHMDGQGRVLGGVIASNDKIFIEDELQPFLRNTGPALSPFNAWVLVKSLETLSLRVEAMSANAAWLADKLAAAKTTYSGLAKVTYPGRADHPQAEIAARQMRGGGSLLTLEFNDGQDAAFAFLAKLELFDISNNLGDAKSLATHPRTTTHHRLSEEERLEQGVTPGLVRLSIGLEDREDLWEDLQSGLESIAIK